MSLADYLAKNYLTTEKKQKKKSSKEKKESKVKEQNVVDRDILLEQQQEKDTKKPKAKVDLNGVDQVKKVSGWKVVGTDEVISELPIIDNDGQRMESGAKPGLQTGAQVAEQIRLKQLKELEYMKSQTKSPGVSNETIHRDSTGRKINAEKLRNDERLLNEQKEAEKLKRLKEFNMGLIQKLDQQDSRQKLKNASNIGLNKYSDDAELNHGLRQKELEDDPLLSFKPIKSKKYVSRTGRKTYKGGFPENRFQIAPGYRWDGVDRSNGFEKEWFKNQIERERQKTLSYTMQED